MSSQSVPPTISLGDDEQRIVFGLEDLCRHTLIFGSSGSGKTTRAFNPMLAEMLDRLRAGAFVIATKAEAVVEAVAIARLAGREAVVVQPGSTPGLELFSGNPDVDATSLRDTLGRPSEARSPWIDAAVARMKNALRMLQAAGEPYYTFDHLTSYCFDETFAAMVRIQALDRLRALDHGADDAWTIREAIGYEDARFAQFAPDTRAAVQFAVSHVLEPLRDVDIAKTFAGRGDLVRIESVFAGAVVVLHVPSARFEGAAAPIYTLAKRRFFDAVERRRAGPTLDRDRPVAFAIDEYERCMSPSDVRSLGIARSAGCMVLATTQGVSSLYAVRPKHQVDAVLQNFTQKIFFKTDDDDTLALLERATDRNANEIETSALSSLSRNQAVCHVTVGDDSVNAIIAMQPLFLTPSYDGGT